MRRATLDWHLAMRALVIPRSLVVFIIVACVSNLIWIHLNAAPPRSWDDAQYLADSVRTFHALERGDMSEFLRAASRPARDVHPPMTKLAPIPMYVVFGAGFRSALYSYTILIPIFCVYLFLLARLITRDDGSAVLAVVVTCCFPLTYGLWRLVMAEFGLAVAVVASQYHLLRCIDGGRSSIKHGVLAGTFIGWGMLWKVSAPVFVAGPLCYLLARQLGRDERPDRRSSLRLLAVIAVVATAIAGPFYLLRMRTLWNFVVYNSTPSASLEQFSLGPVFSPVTVFRYGLALINFGTSAYFFILFAALAILQLRHRRWPVPKMETWFVASCAIVPVLFFSFQYLKEPRHLFPAFAMAGIVIAALLQASLGRAASKVRVGVLAAILVFPAYQFTLLSFDIPWVPSRDIRLGPLVLLAADRESLFVRPANRVEWPTREVVDLIARHSNGIQGRALRVRVAGHIPFLDGPVLDHESMLQFRRPLVYSMLGDRSLHPTWWDFVLVLRGPVLDSSEYREPVLANLLEARQLPFTDVGRVRLPDDREAVLYRASSSDASATLMGENLVIATDSRGDHLFQVSTSEWTLQTGERAVVVTPDSMSSEFQYVYVPDSARLLSWQVVRHPDTSCADTEYTVTVFDLNSRRGPAHSLSRKFTMSDGQHRQVASVGLDPFRGQIVTIRLVQSSPGGASRCVGWSNLMMIPDPPLTK